MALVTQEAGRVAVQTAGVTTPAAIVASTALTLPTASQRPKPSVGILEAVVSIETGTARWTTNGVTPTNGVGMLIQPNTYITLHGENSCSSFRIIATTGSGATITYQFFVADMH